MIELGERPAPNGSSRTPRRRFLLGGLAALAAGLFGKKTTADEPQDGSGLVTEGEILRANVYKGRPPIEPLDTMIRFERSDNNTGRAMTHQVLSLMHEEKGRNSYPWTIYSHLTTHHVEGDACVLCSRLTKNDAGWSAGLHSEVFSNARAVALGVNIEMTNNYTGQEKSQVIGMNVQAHGPEDCQYGIQIHDAGGRFDRGIGLNGEGRIGLDVAGTFEQGVHLHGNSLRLDEGSCIELDGEGIIRIRCRQGRIEFLNGERCVAHIDMNGEDHAV